MEFLYSLKPFEMKVQGMDCTLADKVFAVCDYYLHNDIKKHSRHIYDIYKLLPLVELDDGFRKLATEVREVRKTSSKCPSAREDANISELLQIIIQKEVYKSDYQEITENILEERIAYDIAIKALKQVAEEW